ncbi:helix-turn-helix transcriptional regulator [Nannocystis pusilla]|uniref:helix-turn-helix transcriptional regulator n=1 Tax=Nannocystis pusilla TaxID=889268 RepID=UPI003B76F36A
MRIDDRRPDDRPVFVRHHRHVGRCAGPQVPVVHGFSTVVFYVDGRAEVEQRGRVRVAAGTCRSCRPARRTGRSAAAGRRRGGRLRSGLPGRLRARGVARSVRARAGRRRRGAADPAARQEHLRRVIAELREESTQAPTALQAQVQRSLLTLVLAEVVRAAPVGGESTQAPLVAQALRYIERRCLAPISLRDVAAALDRSPAYVTTALRVATGRTAQQWIAVGRLAEARRRLLTSDETVEAIAGRVGGLDPTHFIRMFRREHGCTPAAWRAEHRRPRA